MEDNFWTKPPILLLIMFIVLSVGMLADTEKYFHFQNTTVTVTPYNFLVTTTSSTNTASDVTVTVPYSEGFNFLFSTLKVSLNSTIATDCGISTGTDPCEGLIYSDPNGVFLYEFVMNTFLRLGATEIHPFAYYRGLVVANFLRNYYRWYYGRADGLQVFGFISTTYSLISFNTPTTITILELQSPAWRPGTVSYINYPPWFTWTTAKSSPFAETTFYSHTSVTGGGTIHTAHITYSVGHVANEQRYVTVTFRNGEAGTYRYEHVLFTKTALGSGTFRDGDVITITKSWSAVLTNGGVLTYGFVLTAYDTFTFEGPVTMTITRHPFIMGERTVYTVSFTTRKAVGTWYSTETNTYTETKTGSSGTYHSYKVSYTTHTTYVTYTTYSLVLSIVRVDVYDNPPTYLDTNLISSARNYVYSRFRTDATNLYVEGYMRAIVSTMSSIYRSNDPEIAMGVKGILDRITQTGGVVTATGLFNELDLLFASVVPSPEQALSRIYARFYYITVTSSYMTYLLSSSTDYDSGLYTLHVRNLQELFPYMVLTTAGGSPSHIAVFFELAVKTVTITTVYYSPVVGAGGYSLSTITESYILTMISSIDPFNTPGFAPPSSIITFTKGVVVLPYFAMTETVVYTVSYITSPDFLATSTTP